MVKHFSLATLLAALVALVGSSPVRSSPVPTPSMPIYDVDVRFEPGTGDFEVDGRMEIAGSPVTRDAVELSLAEFARDPEFFATGEPGARLAASGVVRPSPGRPGWGTTTWRIRLSRPVPAGQAAKLSFRYRLRGETYGNVFHSGPTMAFGTGVLTAWYPELERTAVGPDGRLRGVRGTGELRFQVPTGHMVYASGRQIASSGSAQTFRVESPVFFAFAIARFQRSDRAGPIPATVFQLRERASTDTLLERSQRIVELLSREFSPYPHPRFAIVEIPTGIAERAGFSGASLEGFIFSTTEFLDKRFNTALYGHEIGHQWWPYLIGPDGDAGLYLLTDAMAQHASLRAVEALDGPAAAERYRRSGHPGYYSEYSGRGYFMLIPAGLDAALSATGSSRISRTLAENKGMLVWHMLSREIGPERLRQVFQQLFRKHMYERMTFPAFRRAFEQEAGGDLSWFFDQWFDRAGAPDLVLDWRRVGRKVVGHVRQRGELYRLTVPVAIVGPDGKRDTRHVRVTDRITGFSFGAAGPVSRVVLDPDYDLLRWTDAVRSEAQAHAPYTRAVNAFWAGETDDAIRQFRAALDGPRTLAAGPLRFLLHYGLADALLEKGDLPGARGEASAALRERSQVRELTPLVHIILARVAQRDRDVPEFRRQIGLARSTDRRAGGETGAAEAAAALEAPPEAGSAS